MNRLKKQLKSYTQITFDSYQESDKCNSLRAMGGTLGGGGECLVVAQTLMARDYKGAGNSNSLDNLQVEGGRMIRRLTPIECERLQGFPDNWTDIGEYIDTTGKKRKTNDTARYKALGNSIALPFWKWLLERISAQYDRPCTLGSLFDGIGGFPKVHEEINGEGTAR